MSNGDHPLVSCLLVTANRAELCRRAVHCYLEQTYPNKELVVVDDGEQDLTEVLSVIPSEEVNYLKLEPSPDNVLGHLRNVALDAAKGDYVAQWDDDDWYHPQRLERQIAVLEAGHDAVTLSSSLMHLDTGEFVDHPYFGFLPNGVPGTIVHRADKTVRYPELRRAEDTEYLDHWMARRYTKLDEMHLFIRCFHGANTWEQTHFLSRMKNTPRDLIGYIWHRYIRRNVTGHRRFRITPEAQHAFKAYVADSRRLGLFA